MLRSGANVVTPLGWFFPGHRDMGEIEAACQEGGTIEPGQVAAQRFVWTARVGGTPVVTVQVN